MQEYEQKLCLLCRGAKLLCGRVYCPIIVRSIIRLRVGELPLCREIYGSSPPSLFIGRYGYPKVLVGPATPPEIGDTSIYDLPEKWLSRPLEEIFTYRSMLITGKVRVRVNKVSDKLILMMQELAMAEKPIEIELILKKPPSPRVIPDEQLPPQGPVAPLEKFRLGGNVKIDHRVERIYYDKDLKAQNAVIRLYFEGVPITRIQKVLSIGALGLIHQRKLVPTRWAITAVDDVISRELIRKVRRFPLVNEYLVFTRRYYKNIFIAILAPRPWSFEWIEGWFPKTTWNPKGKKPDIMGDYEGYSGRRNYALIGGCYYASRLATAEYLLKIRKQATAILLREIHPGFYLPIGVWFVRENVRALFRGKPASFDDIHEALAYLKDKTRISIAEWTRHSILLRKLIHESTITKWVEGK